MNGRRCGVRARDWEAVAENSKEGVVKEGGTRMQIDSFSVSFFPSFFSSLSFLTFLLSYRRYNVLVRLGAPYGLMLVTGVCGFGHSTLRIQGYTTKNSMLV